MTAGNQCASHNVSAPRAIIGTFPAHFQPASEGKKYLLFQALTHPSPRHRAPLSARFRHIFNRRPKEKNICFFRL